jgi:hypothetical protein
VDGAGSGAGDNPAVPSTWETCWVPVLEGLIDGALDHRRAVGVASIAAVSTALLTDKHAGAAPARVMMRIMGGMWAPAVARLAEGLRQMEAEAEVAAADAAAVTVGATATAEATAAPIQPVGESAGAAEATAGEETLHSGAAAAAALADGADTAGAEQRDRAAYSAAVEQAIASLCTLFSSQLKRISGKSSSVDSESFDRLWFQVLHVLGIHLHDPQQVRVPDPSAPAPAVAAADAREGSAGENGAVPSTPPTPTGAAANRAAAAAAAPTILVPNARLTHTHEVAYEQLKSMLMVMIVSGVFKLKPALWARTCEYIKTNFLFCPLIVEQLFGTKA